ncbi:family 43 glycosylhydrolase [Paenibacillus oryzisoli]|uniref:family 43 glycosylhydrolase n=1 Tax=Paenibacillus oryzisoli TaxID=1850517 RepID=UPI003D285416
MFMTSKNQKQNAYIMGYFRSGPGQSHKTEQLHYAFSRDGLHWYELNGNKPVWKSSIGEGILRDPFIAKGVDQQWHLVYTTRPMGPSIGYACSKDLIHWTNEKPLRVMTDIPDTVNSWAPEFSYDTEDESYLIYWASSTGKDLSNSKHYCVKTKDWEKFSNTDLFYAPGFQTIDASLAEHDGKYYMAVKDESHVYEPDRFPHPPMNYLAVSDRLEGPYETLPGIQTPDYTEGPEFLWIESEKRWLLYYDYWAYGKYGIMSSTDMHNWSSELDGSLSRFPHGARHGTMFPVTDAELARLLDTYALQAHYRTKTYSPVRIATEEESGHLHDAFSLRTVLLNFRPTTVLGKQVLYDEGDSENGFAIRIQNGCIEGAVCSGGQQLIISAQLSENAAADWQSVALSYADGNLKLFLNNHLAAEGSAAFRLVRSHVSQGGYGGRFGTDAFGDSEGNAPFQGAIEHVRVYDVPLYLEDVEAANIRFRR